MELTKRSGKLGRSINTRTEVHGEDLVPAIDVRLSELVLNAGELDVLLGEGAHGALFRTAGNSVVPRFGGLAPLSVAGKLRDQVLVLSVPPVMGMEAAPPVVLVPATVKDVALEPQEGGTTKLSLMVQHAAPMSDDMASLMEWMGHEVEVAIRPAEKHELAAESEAEVSPQVEAPV